MRDRFSENVRRLHPRHVWVSTAFTILGLMAGASRAADPAPLPGGVNTNSPSQLPEVIVTGQKQPASLESLPVSDTAVTRTTLQDADIQSVRQASIYAPNTFLSEFTARAQSVPYFRGIGGGLGYNPGVTTFIDGVPQLNFYSANIELLDVDQVEILRGPQGGLFGRNTAGGLVNLTSALPSDYWTSQAVGTYGNYNYGDFRGTLSGPVLTNQLNMSLAGGYSSRDGYTTDQFGRGIDGRLAGFGKGQLLYKTGDRFELRLVVSGEHDHDGDYALGELNDLQAHPQSVIRNAGPDNGFNNRDIAGGVLQAGYHGEAFELSSISGASWWRNDAYTDWDYSGSYAPLIGTNQFYENNVEQQRQFTEELRAASSKEKPIPLGKALDFSWQAGVFAFDESYHQNDAKFYVPTQIATATLDDYGVGVYGQAKLTAWDHLEATAGLRFDYEDKHALLGGAAPPNADFSEVSPEFGLAWHFTKDQMAYLRIAEGYKAGGFNALGPPFEYGPEHSWNYEIGDKARWFDGKLETIAALFYIDWRNIQQGQLGAPPFYPYYVVNAGGADSKGLELELKYRPVAGWDLFGSVGYTDAKFQSDAVYLDAPVGGNQLPNTPVFTGNMGTQVSWAPCHAVTLYARAEVTVYGDFQYDASNVAGQPTYSLANFRAGARGTNWFAEGYINNAFNTHYVPIAFDYLYLPGAAGYVGESGAPLTYGMRAGIKF